MKTLYMNGKILTMEDQEERTQDARAVLVCDGRVQAVGDDETLRAMAGGHARIVNLANRTLCPAFIDAHSHFLAVAHSMLQVDLSEVESLEEMSLRIGRYIAAHHIAPGNFVVCRGFDPQQAGGYPHLEAMDALAPGYALVIQHPSGHAGMVNTLALEKLGITPQTRDPEGGRIGRDGERLNGYLEENAFLMVQSTLPAPDMDALMQAMQQAQSLYASHGIVTVQEGLMLSSMLPMYRELLERGLLTLDVVGYPSPQDYGAFAEAFPRSAGGYDRRFRPVSYTHLDVYKRQVHGRGGKQALPCSRIHFAGFTQIIIFLEAPRGALCSFEKISRTFAVIISQIGQPFLRGEHGFARIAVLQRLIQRGNGRRGGQGSGLRGRALCFKGRGNGGGGIRRLCAGGHEVNVAVIFKDDLAFFVFPENLFRRSHGGQQQGP